VSLFPEDVTKSASLLLETCRKRKLLIATAESCTGGLLAASLTSIAGSSDVFERGFVTYSNQAKIDMLGVSANTLSSFGAVSIETAVEMAEGILRKSGSEIGISITGIAGPGGGSDDKPVGLVHMAVCRRSVGISHHECRFGLLARNTIQIEAVRTALQLLMARVASS
jgi:nicotinamide-nucleotide amidase